MGYKENWVDYYELLGVTKESTPEEIKKAYRKMAKQYHPDVNNGEDTVFKQINEAYDILGNENNKKKYDEEYQRRQNGDYTSSDDVEEEQEVNYEDVKKHYTKEEQKFAERLAFKKLLEEELEKVNIIIESKNDLILDAYLNELDKREYYETVKEFMAVGKEFIESLSELAKEAFDRDLLEDEELINNTIDNLLQELDSVPMTPNDAISYIDGVYIKEGIDKKIEEVINKSENYTTELKSILSPIYIKRVLKSDYNRLIYSKMLEGKKILLDIDNVFKILGTTTDVEDSKLNMLREQIGDIKSIMIWFPKHYEDALEISKVYEVIVELNNFLNEFKVFEDKITRISNIIKKHPSNRRCPGLYEYAYESAKEMAKKIMNLKEEYQPLKNGSSSILFSAKELSDKAKKSFVKADKVHRDVYEAYKSSESISYKNGTINYLEKDGLSLEQKIEAIKTLAEIDKVIKASKEVEFFDKEIVRLWREFISKGNETAELLEFLDNAYKFAKAAGDIVANMSNYKKLKQKFIESIILTSTWGAADFAMLKFALGDILFVDERELLTKILAGLGILVTTGMFGKQIHNTVKTYDKMSNIKKVLRYGYNI